MHRFAILLVLAAGAYAGSSELPLAICVDDRARLDGRTRAAFNRELSTLAESGLRIGDTSCLAPARIRIGIRTHAPSRYPGALGLTYTAGGRVLPLIELYVINVVKALQEPAGSERFGRALARVAFHELQHYTRQEKGHDEHGLFSRTMNASALIARDSR